MELVTLGVEVKTTGATQASQQLGQFGTAAKGAAGAADTLENQLRATATAQTQVANTARPLSSAMSGVGRAFQNNTSAIQNASFQLQDIIVQMEMGVPASRVLGQQLPQLLGGFGALGAVVGLAAGALLTFAPAAFGAADSASTLTDTMDQLADAMGRLRDAQEGRSVEDLAAQFGAQSRAAQELLNIQRQIAQIEADRAFRSASGAVVGALGGELAGVDFADAVGNAMALNNALRERVAISDTLAQIQSGSLVLSDEETEALRARQLAYDAQIEQLSQYRLGLRGISEQFGVTEQAAANLVIQMAAVQAADTTQARVAATQDLAKAIDEATGGLNMASDEGIKLYNALLDAALAGLELENLDLAGGISSAASSAAELARQLGISVELAGLLMAAGYERPPGIIFDPRDPRFNPMVVEMERIRREAGNVSPFARPSPSGRAGGAGGAGGSGGAGDAATQLQEAARLYASTRTEAERYSAELDKIKTLFSAGAIDSEVYSRALADLNEKFDPFARTLQNVGDIVEGELNTAFASVLRGTQSLGGALLSFSANVLSRVAQDLFAQQFAAPIGSAVSGFLGGFMGGVSPGTPRFAPGSQRFASGGVVHGATMFPLATGTGVMGEAGPEAIMPLARGADGRLGVAANGNSAPRITINNYSGQDATTSSDSAGNITIEIGRAIAQDITSGGPTYRAIRTTFGLANRLQQRG